MRTHKSPCKPLPKSTLINPLWLCPPGWGDGIKWRSLSDGALKASHQRKPMMVVLHSPHCDVCHSVKKRFQKSREIERLSNYFIMVNVEEDKVPAEKSALMQFGEATPKVLFFHPDGRLMREATGEDNDMMDERYFYSTEKAVITSMRHVLKDLDIRVSIHDLPRKRGHAKKHPL